MPSPFAGIIYPDVLQVSDSINPMLNTLQHQTLELPSIHTYKNFQLGHFGTSFASNSAKTIYAYIDGWLHNEKELQEDLKAAGLPEAKNLVSLIIYAYELWGLKFLEKINGEFALMLLDQEKNQLMLARDPIGKKTLYWYHDKHYFIFSTELKALLATGIVPQTLAADALSSYLFFGFSPQDMTPIRDVNKLLPAHYLLFNLHRGKQILPYWSYSSFFTKRVHQPKNQIISTLNTLLVDSIQDCIPSAGPLGCFVSGGLGSASIAYYLHFLAKGHPLKAFTARFQGESEDASFAKLACHHLNMDQIFIQVTPDTLLEDFSKIVWYLDEPIADVNILATWKLAQTAAAFTNTVFSGMGSDELLAGHARYTQAERQVASFNRLMLLPRSFIEYILIPFFHLLYPPAAYNILRMCKTDPWQFEYLRHSALFDESMMRSAAPNLAGLFDPETFLHKFYNLNRIPSHVSALQYFDVKTRLPDAFMLQYERLTTAFHLTWHTPFLDKNFIEFVAGLAEPGTLLESQTASYLKPLLHAVFPREFVDRPKKTRRHFLSHWVLENSVADLFPLLLRGTLVETGIINEEWLRAQLIHKEKMKSMFPQLFAILTLEIWCRIFLNRSITSSPPDIPIADLLREN